MGVKLKIIKENRLDSIPGIGKSLAQDLMDLGYRRVSDLRGSDAAEMYQRLQDLHGTYIDRCVLYAFRCAIYCASTESPHPDLQKWWNWKDKESHSDGIRSGQ
ncbi:MAG: TfoX/Sxy family DNA transformation protein [Candidatus Krumholzibacteria bacterium]|nr:TfoX/Sxy family DNA transformation protein [Candidatus Krumholzibacteria bacterium]